MDNFGEKVEIIRLQKVENISYKHKISGAVFLSSAMYLSFALLSLFCIFNILQKLGVSL